MKTLLTTTMAFGVIALCGSTHVTEARATHLGAQAYHQPKLQLVRHTRHKHRHHRHMHYYGGSSYIYPPAVSYPVLPYYAAPAPHYAPQPYYPAPYYEAPVSGFSFFGSF